MTEEYLFRSLDKGQSAPPLPPPSLPPMGASLLLRALFKRPGSVPAGALRSEFLTGAVDRAGIDAYNAALRFQPGSTPLTYYYLAVQRAHLVTMLAPAFPYRIAGMVHVENALVLHGAPARGPMRLATRIEILPPTASGAVYCALETEGWCGEAQVLSCTSKYLAVRGKRRRGAPGSASEPAAEAGAVIAEWTLAPSAGRAYARISGDWNPIHLAHWTARLMGLREPIIHGMHSVGMAAARLEKAAGRRVSAISVRFRAPVPLGATLVLVQGEEPGTYALHCRGQLAAEGCYRLA